MSNHETTSRRLGLEIRARISARVVIEETDDGQNPRIYPTRAHAPETEIQSRVELSALAAKDPEQLERIFASAVSDCFRRLTANAETAEDFARAIRDAREELEDFNRWKAEEAHRLEVLRDFLDGKRDDLEKSP